MRDLPPDRDLVTASARGDVRAFGTLVERHHGAVVAVAFAITRDLALSEDIAQETFVVAWTRLGDVIDPSRVRAWLCNIARNRSKNELRRRKREVGEPDDNVVDGAPSPADTMLAQESHAQVLAALAEVPASYREPLVLFYWHEQSIESVASALSISAQAAQKRISRARSFVHEGLVARMQELARERRPAKAAAAAIVAVLATRAAPASAAAHAAASTGATTWLLVLAAALSTALAIGLVAWQRASGADAAAATATEGSSKFG
jgi:RNA polymerase sigma factor (sigma-70 family)